MRRKEKEVCGYWTPVYRKERSLQNPGREARQSLELGVSSLQKDCLPATHGVRMLYSPCQCMAAKSHFCGPRAQGGVDQNHWSAKGKRVSGMKRDWRGRWGLIRQGLVNCFKDSLSSSYPTFSAKGQAVSVITILLCSCGPRSSHRQ